MQPEQYYHFLKAAAEQLNNTQKPKKEGQKKKQYVNKACVHCKSSHVACDSERPCKRCIRLNKQDTCQDAERKKRGRPVSESKEPFKTRPNIKPAIKPSNNTRAITQRPILPHIPPDALQQSRILNILQNNPSELSNLSSAEEFYNALQALSLLIPFVNGVPDIHAINSLAKLQNKESDPNQLIDPSFQKTLEQLNSFENPDNNLLKAFQSLQNAEILSQLSNGMQESHIPKEEMN